MHITGKHIMQTVRVKFLCCSDFIAHHQLITSSQGEHCPTLLAKHSKDKYGRASAVREKYGARVPGSRWGISSLPCGNRGAL